MKDILIGVAKVGVAVFGAFAISKYVESTKADAFEHGYKAGRKDEKLGLKEDWVERRYSDYMFGEG